MRTFPDQSKHAGDTIFSQHQFHPQPHPHDPDVDYSQLLQLETRNISGRNNNQAHPEWGSAGETLLRITKAHYQDGLGKLYDYAHPRAISNIVMAQEEDLPNGFGVSDLFTYFGQFIDHDIDITPTGEEVVTVNITDDIIDSIDFHRSQYVDGTGADGVPREQANLITAFMDSSNVYGSRPEVTTALRSDGGTGAYLLTSKGDYLPTLGQLGDSAPDGIVAGGNSPDLFVAGDVRVNENLALTAMHTIWAREHNYQVDQLKATHPDWTDDQLFNTAQIIVGAEFQHVIFDEYLPLLVGESNIPDYDGYDAGVNPGIDTEFSTAAFRLGHSQLSPLLHRINEDGTEADHGNIRLFEAFFNPAELRNGGGVDPLMSGLAAYKGQEIDAYIIDDVRNFLFGPPGAGQDLALLNIMRSRDHGLPPLNEAREALGLDRYDDFSDLTSDPVLAAKLSEAYDGQIDEVGLWVGGLSEDKVAGSQLGETFQHIVLDQFIRLRDGDRFYYEDRLKDMPDLLEQIEATSFSDIIQRNTGIEYLQRDVFVAHERIGGTSHDDDLTGTDGPDLIIGFQGSDNLHGLDGDDDMYGGPGKDMMYGGPGNDLINGEQGNDSIWTGSGADVIVLERGSGQDTIFDYDIDEDRLDLTDYGYESLSEVAEASQQIGDSTRIFLDQNTNEWVDLIGVDLTLA